MSDVTDAFLDKTKALDLEVERLATELGESHGAVLYALACSWVNRKLEAAGVDLDKHPFGHSCVPLSFDVIAGLNVAEDGLSTVGAALEVIEARR